MSLYISGQPIPAPMSPFGAHKLFTAKEPSKNIVSVTYTDMSPEAKQAYRKTLTGMGIQLASLFGGAPCALFGEMAAQKIFPKLENKFPYVLLGGGILSLLGTITGFYMAITNGKKVKQATKTLAFKDASLNSMGNTLSFQRLG